MAPVTAECEILFNKTSVAHAKIQRLVASWNSTRIEELQNVKSQEEIDREEQEMFTPVPEVFGMGATLPKDGEVKREEYSSNDKLRKELLGKDYDKKRAKYAKENGKSRPSSNILGSKPRPTSVRRDEDDSEGEGEGGRSSLGTSKSTLNKQTSKEQVDEAIATTVDAGESTRLGSGESRPPKRARNYLDEVLSERSRKRQKKNKKKKKADSFEQINSKS